MKGKLSGSKEPLEIQADTSWGTREIYIGTVSDVGYTQLRATTLPASPRLVWINVIDTPFASSNVSSHRHLTAVIKKL
jgi:hypothetical protein